MRSYMVSQTQCDADVYIRNISVKSSQENSTALIGEIFNLLIPLLYYAEIIGSSL